MHSEPNHPQSGLDFQQIPQNPVQFLLWKCMLHERITFEVICGSNTTILSSNFHINHCREQQRCNRLVTFSFLHDLLQIR